MFERVDSESIDPPSAEAAAGEVKEEAVIANAEKELESVNMRTLACVLVTDGPCGR